MLMLALDSTGRAASCALLEEGTLLAETYGNIGFTHSETLLPLVLETLKAARRTLAEVERMAVTVGPGSFTGQRIGVATAKGLAFPGEIPCVPVSALAAMGQLCPPVEGVLCPCMDARRSQVYNALFEWRDGRLHRLAEDRALSVEALGQELLALGRPVWLTGDGAALCAAQFAATEAMKALPVRLAPEHSRHQRALGAALWAVAEGCEPIPPAELMPFYLRPPQAERERLARGGEPGMPPTRDYLV